MIWSSLLAFSAAFAATILLTPRAIFWARWLGAVDRPDGFRRAHRGAVPRMGGLAVALGVAVAMVLAAISGLGPESWHAEGSIHFGLTAAAIVLVLALGILDDQQQIPAGQKLLGQAVVAWLLLRAGFRIERMTGLGFAVDLGMAADLATMAWFLGCMNIWNLIDGMDGLASGIGMMASLTLGLAAATFGHSTVAAAALALAGALAGFLLYNFHPARIFLGDTGSLFLGTFLGVLGLQGAARGPGTVAILIPLLAMAVPITDTCLAIARRWIRGVPLMSADRDHLHHQLLGMGMSPRQATLLLYGLALLPCLAVVGSVRWHSDALALAAASLGLPALAFLAMRRGPALRQLAHGIRNRLLHRQRERRIAAIVWCSIERASQATSIEALGDEVEDLAWRLGCDAFLMHLEWQGSPWIERWADRSHRGSSDTEAHFMARHTRPIGWAGWLTIEFRQLEKARGELALASQFLDRFASEVADQAARFPKGMAEVRPRATSEQLPADRVASRAS